jgi:excisionase family DNA binding protein
MKNHLEKKDLPGYEKGLFDNLIWLNTKEAAEFLRVSPNSLRIMVCRGEIPSYKLGKRLRFKKSELDELLESSKTDGGFYGD